MWCQSSRLASLRSCHTLPSTPSFLPARSVIQHTTKPCIFSCHVRVREAGSCTAFASVPPFVAAGGYSSSSCSSSATRRLGHCTSTLASSFESTKNHQSRSLAAHSTSAMTTEASSDSGHAIHHPASEEAIASAVAVEVPVAGPPSTLVPGLKKELQGLFQTALAAAFPNLQGETPIIAACSNLKFGDFQCNNAMPLFAKLKGTPGAPKAPRDVANAILANLPASPLIIGTSLAGPGFINVKLSRPVLAQRISSMLTEGIATWAPSLHNTKVVLDFSSPNVAKEMHVGHLRSTIIGDTLARMMEYCGANVLRINHVGDWGTQFGMLIEHMSELRPEGLGAEGGREEDVADLQKLYREAKKRFDAEPDFKKRAQQAVTRLQSGDEVSLKAWKRICAASRKEFDAIYKRLDIKLTERGESYYNPRLHSVVNDLKDSGIAVESEGALCIFQEGKDVPLIIQKKDGGFGYGSTDMACLSNRLFEEKGDWLLYVVDCGQADHFQAVFAAGRKAGWYTPESKRVEHIGFGLVLGEDGKRLKTRSGDLVRLVDLLDEAKQRCYDSVKGRREEQIKMSAARRAAKKAEAAAELGAAAAEGEDEDEVVETVDEAELDMVSSVMGYGAVKYADLKNNRMSNYKFSFDEMLSLKGNTAVYLLYAHARIAGIVRKSGKDVAALAAAGNKIQLDHPKEDDLAFHITKFPDMVEEVLQDMLPNRITEYLYELSEYFNSFYTECKVIGSEQETSRLLLAEATAVTMRQCFTLLGIKPLYRI